MNEFDQFAVEHNYINAVFVTNYKGSDIYRLNRNLTGKIGTPCLIAKINNKIQILPEETIHDIIRSLPDD